jgi:lipopolysaccharide transport system ATP-binding protein
MSETVIKVENISKFYQLGLINHGTLAKDLQAWWAKIRGKDDPNSRISMASNKNANADTDFIYALKDVSFDVRQGEVLGIIGANGAGKSTLLKILSRVTSPTSGCIKIKGRIGSLLEVGTGFHPELTGRENIYLNGAILGMRKHEIDRKLDEIIDFSGVEKFIDTPVKRYSSGMYVRLAFAVAAHLDPEILVVDEVLAVGDAEFQKKCLGKMGDVSKKEGRTVLFVSHNMAAVRQLCDSCITLQNGFASEKGSVETQIAEYLNYMTTKQASLKFSERPDRKGNGNIRISKIEIFNLNGDSTIHSGDDVVIRISYDQFSDSLKSVTFDIGIDNELDIRIAHLSTKTLGIDSKKLLNSKKIGSFDFIIKSIPLYPGKYFGTFCVYSDGLVSDWLAKAFCLEVAYGDFYKTNILPPRNQGNLLLNYEFTENK